MVMSAALVLAAVITPGAQVEAVPDTANRPIAFTTATVTRDAATNSFTVSWTAPGAGSVAVYEGSQADGPGSLVGVRGESDTLFVPATTGPFPFFRLRPDRGGSVVVDARVLGLASAPNFRDAGGYRTTNGRWVRTGAFYRAPALTLTDADLQVVRGLGIRSVFDLRTTLEIAAEPDVDLPGTEYFHDNVLAAGLPSPPASPTTDELLQYLRQGYTEMVLSPTARSAFHDLLAQIADSDGPFVVHCTGGQDRTGLATVFVLTLLGVPESTVRNDYLLSWIYNQPVYAKNLASMPPSLAAAWAPTMTPEAASTYLQTALQAITQHYGSMENYAINGLGLSHATLSKLRHKLLVGAPSGRPHD